MHDSNAGRSGVFRVEQASKAPALLHAVTKGRGRMSCPAESLTLQANRRYLELETEALRSLTDTSLQ
jgi:hypothetical protein